MLQQLDERQPIQAVHLHTNFLQKKKNFEALSIAQKYMVPKSGTDAL